MYDTHYVKTSSITEAAKALSAAKDGKLLAGGMTLIPNETTSSLARLSC